MNMKYSILLALSIFFGGSFVRAQQAINPKYTKKLERLYKHSVPLVEAEEAREILAGDDEVLVLDTRTQREYEVSHIPGAKFVDYDAFDKKDWEGLDRDQQVIVYCSVGYRSERIGEKLQKMGFQNVSNLYGGIFEWKNLGNEVVDTKGQPTEQVHTYNADWSKWLLKGERVTR